MRIDKNSAIERNPINFPFSLYRLLQLRNIFGPGFLQNQPVQSNRNILQVDANFHLDFGVYVCGRERRNLLRNPKPNFG